MTTCPNPILAATHRSAGVMDFSGKRVLVVGLGRFGGGVGVTRWLAAQGALVTVTDQADAASLSESLQAISDLPVTLRIGGHNGCDLSATDLAVINPAVQKTTSPFFAEILRAKIPWTTEINLFCERCPAPVIGVTGSFGKSTTCAMLAGVLESQLQNAAATHTGVFLGGNIGRSLLGELSNIRPTDLVVLEMSNAQLEDLPPNQWSPEVSVITNLHPQHLDRHGTFEAYIEAKLNLIRAGARQGPVIVGELHPEAERRLAAALRDRPDRLVRVTAPPRPIELTLPGRHNQANAVCVWTVCRTLGISDDVIRVALREFRGLPHRLEYVRTVSEVRYINDSKSTAPAATIIAMEAIMEAESSASGGAALPRRGVSPERPLIVIVGGQRKDVSLQECVRVMTQCCRAVIGYGQAGPAFSDAVRRAASGSARSSPAVHDVADVAAAVEWARRMARPGETVLFSPGAPSFDQYVNFTARGNHFVELVKSL